MSKAVEARTGAVMTPGKVEVRPDGGASYEVPRDPGVRVAVDPAVCSRCRNEIDPDCCWCGGAIDRHNPMNDGHTPVPWGCTCGYVKREDKP